MAKAASSLLEGEESFLGEEAVHSSVGFTTLAHEASKGNDVALSGHFTVFINLNKIVPS